MPADPDLPGEHDPAGDDAGFAAALDRLVGWPDRAGALATVRGTVVRQRRRRAGLVAAVAVLAVAVGSRALLLGGEQAERVTTAPGPPGAVTSTTTRSEVTATSAGLPSPSSTSLPGPPSLPSSTSSVLGGPAPMPVPTGPGAASLLVMMDTTGATVGDRVTYRIQIRNDGPVSLRLHGSCLDQILDVVGTTGLTRHGWDGVQPLDDALSAGPLEQPPGLPLLVGDDARPVWGSQAWPAGVCGDSLVGTLLRPGEHTEFGPYAIDVPAGLAGTPADPGISAAGYQVHVAHEIDLKVEGTDEWVTASSDGYLVVDGATLPPFSADALDGHPAMASWLAGHAGADVVVSVGWIAGHWQLWLSTSDGGSPLIATFDPASGAVLDVTTT